MRDRERDKKDNKKAWLSSSSRCFLWYRRESSSVVLDWCLSPIGCNHLKLFFFFLFFILSFCFIIATTYSIVSGKPKRKKKEEKKYVRTRNDDRNKKKAAAVKELKRHCRTVRDDFCFVLPCQV
jgi:hypothetical protein